ncbi:MAG: DNA polymerase [Candidatus Aenigmatarchaeota archaeon]
MVKIIGLDFETIKKDNVHQFYSFQVFSEDISGVTGVYYDKKQLYNIFSRKTNNSIFLVFNLAFDSILLSEILSEYKPRNFREYKYDVVALYQNSNFKYLRITKGNLKFKVYDLMNILQVRSLAQASKIINMRKLQKPRFLGERGWENEKEKQEFEKYAINDAEICFRLGKAIFQEFNTIKSTAGGIAIRVFKRDFVHKYVFSNLPKEFEEKIREAYHGGRVECLKRGTIDKKIYAYDVISMYPFVMKTFSYPFVVEKPVVKTNINLDNEGIAFCKVYVDHEVPPLCKKLKFDDGFERLVFPSGIFETAFTYPELRLLNDNHSLGKILDVKYAIEYKHKFNPFEKFVDHFYELKRKAEQENNPKRAFYKLMLNALYGKFGEKGILRIIKLNSRNIEYEKEIMLRKRWYNNVVLASYITAYARLVLWQYMRQIGFDRIYYCDTDSLFVDKPLILDYPKELGKLKFEGEAKEYESTFIRSKFYVFGDKIVCKGFRINIEKELFYMMIYTQNFTIIEHKITKLLESLKQSLIPLTDIYYEKKFDISEDKKRVYEKQLNNFMLLIDYSDSFPIMMREE